MGLKPFFTYFGGKWRIAPRYPAPTRDLIVEPFAGSAGYSLRYPDRAVLLCDVFKPIVETWRYLIGASAAEILALPDVEDGQNVDDLDLPPGARYFIGWWLNKGSAVPCKIPGLWMRQSRSEGETSLFWGRRVRERVAQQVDTIKHWTVLECSYSDLEPADATWFVDPPYQQAGKHYIHGSKTLDFKHLGSWCQTRGGQMIVCENAGADWLPFEPFLTAQGTGGSGRTGKSVEVIYMQG
jgi:site-specific DNA-adenine methylase